MDSFNTMREEAHRFVKDKETEFFKSWCAEAGVETPVGYYNSYEKLIVYTDRPGLLIGKGGSLVKKYQEIFRKEFYHPKAVIEFVEVRGGFTNYG